MSTEVETSVAKPLGTLFLQIDRKNKEYSQA